MSSEKLTELQESDFEEAIQNGVTLVDFWAPWCGPCRMLTPVLEKVADEVGDKATIAKVNVDDAPSIAAKFGIRSIPTMIVFKDGSPVKQFVGVQPEQAILAEIDAAVE